MTNQAIQEKYNLQPISEVLRQDASSSLATAIAAGIQPHNLLWMFSFFGTQGLGTSNYRMILGDETQLEETQLQEAMLDRKRWRRLVNR